MSIDAIQISALRGGHLQWTCKVGNLDLTSYLVSVEGVTKRISFDCTPTSADVTIKIAGCQPSLLAGQFITVGLNTTDTFDASYAIWKGTINEVTELSRVVELRCNGQVSACDKDYLLNPNYYYAQNPREMYNNALGCFVDRPFGIPAYTDSHHRNATKVSLPTSTLGGLSGVKTSGGGFDVYRDGSTAFEHQYEVADMEPIIDLQDWKTCYGTAGKDLCRSKLPLDWHWRGLYVNFYMQARCDSGRTAKCYWPLGYDQYFDAWFTVYRNTSSYINMNSVIKYHTEGVPTNHGWWHSEGEEREVIDERHYNTKGKWTAAAVISGLLGLSWGTTIAASIKARKNEISKNTRSTKILSLFPPYSTSPFTPSAKSALFVSGEPTGAIADVADEQPTIAEEVHLVDNDSKMDDPDHEGQQKFVYEAFATLPAGQKILTTTYQFHGTLAYTHPDLTTHLREWYGSTLQSNLRTQYRVRQSFRPLTINQTETSCYAVLPELGQLAGVCVFENGNGLKVADLTPESGSIYEIPLLPCNTISFAYNDESPLPTAADVQFRDAYGNTFTYNVPVDPEGSAENKGSFTLCQGNVYRGKSIGSWYDVSGVGRVRNINISSDTWEGSPGCVADRLTGVKSDLTYTRIYPADGMQVIDKNGLVSDAINVSPTPTGISVWTKDTANVCTQIDNPNTQHIAEMELFTDSATMSIEDSKAKKLDTTQPLLDIFPINQMVKAHHRVFSSNPRRKTYTANTSMNFAFCEPGTLVIAALPDYQQATSYVMMVTSVVVNVSSCTLTLCPMAPVSSYNEANWTHMAEVAQIVNSYYNRG